MRTRSPFSLVRCVLVAAAIVVAVASPASAQDRLFGIVSTQTAGSVVPRHSLMAINWVGRRLPSEEVRVVVP